MKTLKYILLTLLLSCTAVCASAQDVILKKDNSTIISKVTKISKTEIEYKKWSNLDGPTYTISVADVLSINYANGDVEHYNETPETPTQATTPSVTTTQSSEPIMSDNLDLPQYGKGTLVFKRGRKLMLDDHVVSDEEAKAIFGTTSYEEYVSGKKFIRTSNIMLIGFYIASAPTVLGLIVGISNSDPGMIVIGGVGLSILVPCFILNEVFGKIGYGKINDVIYEYNMHNTSVSARILPSIMNINTPQLQNNYGLGLTFSVNF